ncbi:MAG TPA: tetratricopeptide repeat protein [Candidatus Polarisedimenticolia bacterium]|nr:tetratricopeptide repeat protein [Candidatus Polarisedimenticolia bacterium]
MATYLCAGLAYVHGRIETAYRDCRLLGESTRALGPGWKLSPPGACRISRYPLTPQDFPFDLPAAGESKLSSREGVETRVRGDLRYLVPADTSARVHHLASQIPLSNLVAGLVRDAVEAEVRKSSFSRISGTHRLELEGSLDAHLGAQLRERGLLLSSLRIDSVRMAESPQRQSYEPIVGARLLLIGLDGADWRILDDLLAQGRLPTLKRLIDNGVRARLKTVDPVLSPVVWTSAATGFLPSEHGILDFLVKDRTGRQVPVTSAHRKVKAIWNLLSEAGVSVGIIGWWATWPAEQVEGYVVSDRVAYQLFGQADSSGTADTKGKTYPEDLYARIRPLIRSPKEIESKELKRYLNNVVGANLEKDGKIPSREEEFRTLLASTMSYAAIASALGSNHLQGFEAIYFEGIDTVSHLFMPFRAPQRPGISDADYERYHRAVDEFYVYQDEILGTLLERVPPEVGILVISDHGFKSESDRPMRESRINFASAAQWHRRHGILIASGGAFRRGGEVPELSVMDVTPTILAYFGLPIGEDMQGRPAEALFSQAFLQAHAPRYRPSWESYRSAASTGSEDPAGDQALMEKLRSLGYLSGEGDLTANNLGNSLLAQGKIEESIQQFRKAVALSPRLSMAHVNLGRALLAKGDLVQARIAIDEALRLDPGSPDAQLLMASLEATQGSPDLSERRLLGIVLKDPGFAGAYRMLGSLHRTSGKLSESADDFRKALAIDPEDSEAWNGLGVALREGGRPEEAETAFRKALDADPESTGALNNLAVGAMERGDARKAGELLEQAARLAPHDPGVRNNLGNLLAGRGDLSGADREYRAALQIDPQHPQALNGLAALSEKRGNLEEAETLLHRAIASDPRYAEARLNLAGILVRKGRRRDAMEQVQELLRVSPGHAAASRRLAEWMMQEGQAAQAGKVCMSALQAHPEDPNLWSLRGEALAREGKAAEAVECFRKSLEINPYQPELAGRVDALAERAR